MRLAEPVCCVRSAPQAGHAQKQPIQCRSWFQSRDLNARRCDPQQRLLLTRRSASLKFTLVHRCLKTPAVMQSHSAQCQLGVTASRPQCRAQARAYCCWTPCVRQSVQCVGTDSLALHSRCPMLIGWPSLGMSATVHTRTLPQDNNALLSDAQRLITIAKPQRQRKRARLAESH